jgi:hypothetical protein
MSTGYDDRFEGGGYDDRGPDGRGPGGPPGGSVERARARVRVPAVLLILTGAVGLLLTAVNLINYPNLGAQLDDRFGEMKEKIDKDPKLTDDQKREQKDMLGKVRDGTEQAALPVYLVHAVVALVVLLGGVKMLSLSGRGLAITGSVLAMIPCVNSLCCIVGLPVGIWALVVLSDPGVKAAFGATARDPYAPPTDV